MNQVIKHDDWILVYEKTNVPVVEGDVVHDFRGEADTIRGGRPPHKPSSTGFVWTASVSQERYPGVFDLKWIKTK